MSDEQELEHLLLSLLTGEHSSLTLSLNDGNASNYQSVRQMLSEPGYYANRDEEPEWVSDDSRERAMATNRMWKLQWYPNTPVGFNDIAAATLVEIIEYLRREAKP